MYGEIGNSLKQNQSPEEQKQILLTVRVFVKQLSGMEIAHGEHFIRTEEHQEKL